MKIYIAFILITLSSCSTQTQEEKTQDNSTPAQDTSKTRVISSHPNVESESITVSAKNGIIKFINRNDSIFYTSSSNNKEGFLIAADSDNGESIAEFKTIDHKGNKYLLINISSNGTAGFNSDELVLIDTINGALQKIEINYATNIQKGKLNAEEEITHDETREYFKDSIVGIFDVGLKSDPGCCPSVGEIKTLYQIVNDNGKWKMLPDTMIFTPNKK